MQLGYFFRRSLRLPAHIFASVQSWMNPACCRLIFLALSLVAQSLVNAVPFFIDRVFLGHFSSEALASLQISATAFFSLFAVISAFTFGASVVIRRAVDVNSEIAGASVRGTILLSLFIGSVAAIASFCGVDQLCGLFPLASFGVAEAAKAYLYWVIPALPIYLLVMSMAAILQVFGDAKKTFRIACLSACLHVFLGYVLIFGFLDLPAMGVKGAAIASVIAASLQCMLLFRCMRKNCQIAAIFSRFGGEMQAMKSVLTGSFSSFIERSIHYGSYFLFMVMVGFLGNVAMAAQQGLIALGVLCFVIADGFGIAASQMKEPEARIATRVTALLLSIVAIFFLLTPSFFMQLFTSDVEIIALGSCCLQVFALVQPLTAIAVVFSDALRGKGNSKTAALISLFGAICIRLPAAYYFAFVLGLGLVGIWWGIAADWFVRCILLASVYARRRLGIAPQG